MSNSSPCTVMEPGVQEALRISDLYRKKLGQAANFRRMAVEEDCTELVRSHFRDRAFGLESHASYLAHCLALFGDIPFPSVDYEKYISKVKSMTCEEHNPWLRGLNLIKEEVQGISVQP